MLAIVAVGHCAWTMAMQSSGEAADPIFGWPSLLLSLSIQLQPAQRFTDGAAVAEGAAVGIDDVGAGDTVGALVGGVKRQFSQSEHHEQLVSTVVWPYSA